jgi:multidrug transporter EmrE-like cation transporter
MLYLWLAIICSASIALIFKHSESRGMNRYAVTTANYLAASVVSIVILFSSGLPLDLPGGWAMLLGLMAGAVFFSAFMYYQISVKKHGVGLAGTFAKLGILVPMTLSLVLWKEHPSSLQWLGISLAVLSIVAVNWPSDKGMRNSLRSALLLLFLFGGMAEFSNKVYQKYGLQEYKALFLLVTFGTAFLYSGLLTWMKGLKVTRRDLITGLAVGIPNLFSSFFLILALETIPAAVAFPIFGAGTIVIINVVGMAFFRERLTRIELAAVGLTVVAIVLINL